MRAVVGCALLLSSAAACGRDVVVGPDSIDPSWIDKRLLAGEAWRYTRSYEAVALPTISVGVTKVMTEELLVFLAPGPPLDDDDEVAVAWSIAGHFGETDCEVLQVTDTIQEPGCPWYRRPYLAMDWARVLPTLDRLDSAVEEEAAPPDVQALVEDGHIDVLSWHVLRLAESSEAQRVRVHQRVDRVDAE